MTPLKKLRFRSIYSEVKLYRAALDVYKKPLFSWRKALSRSFDGRTLYDFAEHSSRNLDLLHHSLMTETYNLQPYIALDYNFNGKHRRIYVPTWEDRIVDRCLYELLNSHFNSRMSISSYAYRCRGGGLDSCQRNIARYIRESNKPLFICKRDIRNFFPNISQEILLNKVKEFVAEDDYLFQLLKQRIHFCVQVDETVNAVKTGTAFGTPLACFFANLYLTDLDQKMTVDKSVFYSRYADDFFFASSKADTLDASRNLLATELDSLELELKPAATLDIGFSLDTEHLGFTPSTKFRHLGLEFREDGGIGLSRDKLRKIRNLFRFAFRRHRSKLKRAKDLTTRTKILVDCANQVLERRLRNIAIVDYYLKHVDDELQLKLLDRWLAEEVLARALESGHRKSNFRLMPFKELRKMGLPSLRHRRRLLKHGHISGAFFQLRTQRIIESERRRRLPSH
jgi:retron-type reverse transcriptase